MRAGPGPTPDPPGYSDPADVDRALLERLNTLNNTLTTQWNRLQNIRNTVDDTSSQADRAQNRVQDAKSLIERAQRELDRAKEAVSKVVSCWCCCHGNGVV